MATLAFTKDKNQIGTPWHIVEFMYDLTNARGCRVLDPAAGNGNLLEFADEKYGVELDAKAYDMLCERYGPGENFRNASLFDCGEWIHSIAPEVVLMNPPFNVEKTKGLEFVRFVVENIDRGVVAAILPSGAICGTGKAFIEVKEKILERAALKYVLSLSSDIFYPAVSVATCLVVFEVGAPQEETYFADFSYDGLEKDRTQGVIDKSGKWADIKARWLEYCKIQPDYENVGDKEEGYIFSGHKAITAGESWLPSSVVPFTPGPVTDEDLYKTVKEYMTWRINQVGLQQFLKENPHLMPSKEERLMQLLKAQKRIQEEIEKLI